LATQRQQFASAHEELTAVFANAKQPPLVLSASLARGELSLAENQLPAALRDARTAVATAKQLQGGVAHSSRVGQASLLLARVQRRQGETAQARRTAQTAYEHLVATVDDNHPALVEAQSLMR
jgi:hypothetical protein